MGVVTTEDRDEVAADAVPLATQDRARWEAALGALAPQVRSLVWDAPCERQGDAWTVRVPPTVRDLLLRKGAAEALARALGDGADPAVVKLVAQASRELGPPSPVPATPPAPRARSGGAQPRVLWGRAFRQAPTPIRDLPEGEGERVVVEGFVVESEVRPYRQGSGAQVRIDLTDRCDSVTLRASFGPSRPLPPPESIAPGRYLRVRGRIQFDAVLKEPVLRVDDAMAAQPAARVDRAPVKRVELHLHTRMSTMDALVDPGSLVARAAAWGHPAVAITDHGGVQAFPEAAEHARGRGVKVIYGLEAFTSDPYEPILDGVEGPLADLEWVACDIETTALSPLGGEIIEVGAVRFRGGTELGRFSSFIRPLRPVRAFTTELTGITPDMLRDQPEASAVLARFWEFARGAVFVAHNAAFDLGFLLHASRSHGLAVSSPPWLDTLALSRALRPGLKNHRLDEVARALGVQQLEHHRALDDARVAGRIAAVLLEEVLRGGVTDAAGLAAVGARAGIGRSRADHTLILATDPTGLETLYRLVTLSHLEHFHRVPRIPWDVLEERRQGLLLGSGCTRGALARSLLSGRSPEELVPLARRYDFIEVQPPGALSHLVAQGVLADADGAKALGRLLVTLGELSGVEVVATGDVHYPDPEDAMLRQVLVRGQGGRVDNASSQLHLRTTEEMLEEFSYLEPTTAHRVVVEASRRIAERCQELEPVPRGTFAPQVPGAEEAVARDARAAARMRYGDPLPPIVAERLERELTAIMGGGFAPIYHIARLLVEKSTAEGYLVGSRGSVGSSLVANLLGITEVNPLIPHYRCPDCTRTEFPEAGTDAGPDLPPRVCPCGTPFLREGLTIPFETFMGFEGEKVPDIDLNFSGEVQGLIHRYAESLLGEGSVFRAGTIATIAERTAYGLVKGQLEAEHRTVRQAELNRLARGIIGVKRTTGQHPGGLMIVPRTMDVHAFTPLQRPADDPEAETVTTHFDYHAISSRLLKLDLLGHDDPTMLRRLEAMTGDPARAIDLGDRATLSLFSSTEAIGVEPEAIGSQVATFGIPEFNTRFVRGMLEETRPRTFSDLVRLSGLSHGTDVWNRNAQDWVRQGLARLDEVISTRDDIMTGLIQRGLAAARAFAISERVRKGKGLTEEDEADLRRVGAPDWYVESCRRISYLYPRAHAVAYVTMAVRIGYYKVHHPMAFYATYFTVRAEEFDARYALEGQGRILEDLRALEQRSDLTARERSLVSILEVAREMYARGIRFLPLDVNASDAVAFTVSPDGIRPPWASVPGLGAHAARRLVAAKADGPFLSVDDLRRRARIPQPVLAFLEAHGVLGALPATNQMTLFG